MRSLGDDRRNMAKMGSGEGKGNGKGKGQSKTDAVLLTVLGIAAGSLAVSAVIGGIDKIDRKRDKREYMRERSSRSCCRDQRAKGRRAKGRRTKGGGRRLKG